MKLSERHFISINHQNYTEIDDLSFKSKNLYNKANYIIRQEFTKNNKYINYVKLDKLMQKEPEYKLLPAKVSQGTLKLLDRNWSSFFAANKEFRKNPSKFKCSPKIPKYLDKANGRFALIYSIQAIKKDNKLSGTKIQVNTKRKTKEIRIVHKKFGYIIEVVYEKEELKQINNENWLSIDIGVNNLCAITSNQLNNPILINGRPLKSINQYYNKQLSLLKSEKKKQKAIKKRYFRIQNYFNKVSKLIIDLCSKNNISKIVIGHNNNWKQKVNLGKTNNQNFVYIPFNDLIQKISYKAELSGINVIITEESYTSKASSLDEDELIKGTIFTGERVKRGLYRKNNGEEINSDLNGSLNIARKVINVKADRSLVARPLRVKNPYKHKFL